MRALEKDLLKYLDLEIGKAREERCGCFSPFGSSIVYGEALDRVVDIMNKWCEENTAEGSWFMINKDKRILSVGYNGNVYIQKWQDGDEFDWRIGLGLALSKAINNKKFKDFRWSPLFRNKKNVLDYKKYSKWVLLEIFQNYRIFDKRLDSLINDKKIIKISKLKEEMEK